MKRTFLAPLFLVCPLAASAQSSVTVFGVIDLNLTYARVGKVSSVTEGINGVSPSRLGFRGVEDLGDGYSAGFWLEGAILPDTGGSGAGGLFARRSTASLASRSWGELRLGRDYTPSFWNHANYSPFATDGVAGSVNVVKGWPNGLGNARTQARDNNLVQYFLPDHLGGFYGSVQAAPGEGVDGQKTWGSRVGYGKGPFDAAFVISSTDANGSKYRQTALGGTCDFTVVKLYADVFVQKLLAQKQVVSMAGISVPVGPKGFFKLAYSNADMRGAGVDDDDARMIGVGYDYHWSKRTQVYATYAHIANKGNAAFVTTSDASTGVPGRNAQGIQAGINHAF
jgi:predicted porin